jgi:pyruvate/2-oxoglutarate/acetoin dehydrogenase E1 component
MRSLKFSSAIREGILQSMSKNKNVIVLGLGVTDPKGIFGTTVGLEKKFGAKRVFEIPASENAITGVAIGAALKGARPILIHQRVEFSLLSLEQIINQAAKLNYMSGGKLKVPLVIRLIIGKGWGQGPQHSQSLENIFASIPGLKVISPSNSYDAKGMIVKSIKQNSPVIIFEHRWLHELKNNVPKKFYEVNISKAKVINKGKDITIISFSEALAQVKSIKEILIKNKIYPEIIDLRSLRPIDKSTLIKSLKKTKNLLVVDNGWKTLGISSEILSIAFESGVKLKNKPIRIGIKEIPIPSSRFIAEKVYFNPVKILEAVMTITKKRVKKSDIHLFKKKLKMIKTDVPDIFFKGPF